MKFKATRAFYKSVFDNLNTGLSYCEMMYDREGRPVDFRYIKVNKNFERMAGIKNVEGKTVTQLIPGILQTNPKLFEVYGRVASTGRSEQFEEYVEQVHKWNLISTFSTKKKYFVTLRLDITDIKQMQINLINSRIAALNVLEDLGSEKSVVEMAKAKEEVILLSIADGLVATNEMGNIILINNTAQRLLGKKSEEVVGKNIFDVFPIENEKGISIPLEKRAENLALATGATTTTTTTSPLLYGVRSDTSKFPMAITVSPVILGGKVIGSIEVFRDITKEREVDRAKTEFVSLASHQLRTPLSGVRWYTDMLADGDAGAITEKQKRYLEEIRHGNARMVALVNILLNVSRMELGATQVTVESVQLSKVISNVLHDLELQRKAKDISVEVTIPSSLPPLMTDNRLVHIVVENVLSNAIKYTGQQGKVIVTAVEVSKGELFGTHKALEKSVGFSVTDDGIGIPDSEQDQIFNKLFRAENARLAYTDGAGLGLYLTRLVLQRLKGEIWFASHVGKGTTFFILLPYKDLVPEKELSAITESDLL